MKIITLLALLLLTPVLSFGSGQRTTHAAAPAGRTNRGGEIGYAMVRVRRTRIMFPRLTRFSNTRVMNEVNHRIDEATREFGCSGRNSYYNLRSKVEYADRDVFSIYASAGYFCGGAYPTNDANMSMTFDMRTGKQIKFEELFKNYEADKSEILKTIFARQLALASRVAASGRPKEDTCEGDPDLFNLENLGGSTFAFNFSKNGLSVQPEWPHVVEACAERVTVPYDKLMKFAAPDGLLTRVR